ncbi:MAG: DNA polymerase I, partial [Oscillospiraceae bacterium]|nr:DNA polymerase I [Oscillospiraceae bacterium]
MKIMVLDGNSILNRAFYGVRPLTNKAGMHTQAIYGFLTILGKLKKQDKPDYVCVAFDMKAPTFRHEMYDGYKATRKPMPDELAEQLPYLKRVLDAMGIPRYELPGWEADDILGAAAKFCSAADDEALIVSGDRDSLQLISDRVSVRLVKGKGESILYDEPTFIAEYGFYPQNLIDLKALMGDSSDNIPGVKGVGEKTASELIAQYSTLDEVYANLGKLKPALKTKLEMGRELAYLSYRLAQIAQDAPVEFNFSASAPRDDDELYRLFTELEFNSLIKSYGLIPPASQAASEPQNGDAAHSESLSGEPADDLAAYLLDPVSHRNYSADEAETLLKEQGMWTLYTDIELPLSPILREMEQIGFKVNRDALFSFGASLDHSINRLAMDIFDEAGEPININSSKQLSELLFNTLGMTAPPFTRKTKTGGYSTDAETLEKLRGKHPIISMILDYRKVAKLKSTYVDGLMPQIDDSGRIHTTFNQTQTATGRLSSLDPNLQNIPVRGETGAELRKFFITEPGWKLIDADYSQIELRILAHLSQDPAMCAAFLNNEDIHTATAAQVFKTPPEKVTKLQRSRAKAVNFGIVYGISDFSLSQDIGVPRAEAKEYIETYLEHFSGVKAYMERVIAEAKQNGYASTMFGRRRYLPELKSSNFNTRSFGERVARNMPIQGAAADIIKIAMLKVHARFKS